VTYYGHCWKIVWQFLIKFNIILVYDPIIPLLDIYPRKHMSTKDLDRNVAGRAFQNSFKLETTQRSR
jgi:hypothetical protein